MKEYLTIPQLADMLRVSESTARRLVTGRADVPNVGLGKRKHARIPETVARSLRAELLKRW